MDRFTRRMTGIGLLAALVLAGCFGVPVIDSDVSKTEFDAYPVLLGSPPSDGVAIVQLIGIEDGASGACALPAFDLDEDALRLEVYTDVPSNRDPRSPGEVVIIAEGFGSNGGCALDSEMWRQAFEGPHWPIKVQNASMIRLDVKPDGSFEHHGREVSPGERLVVSYSHESKTDDGETVVTTGELTAAFLGWIPRANLYWGPR